MQTTGGGPARAGRSSDAGELARLIASAIRPMRESDAATVARLHVRGIPGGFLSTLGEGFLTELYSALPDCPSGFGFTFELAGEPFGFIACAADTGRLHAVRARPR